MTYNYVLSVVNIYFYVRGLYVITILSRLPSGLMFLPLLLKLKLKILGCGPSPNRGMTIGRQVKLRPWPHSWGSIFR